jgi:hypothetical protein
MSDWNYEDRYPSNWGTRARDTKRSRQQGDTVQCSCCGGHYYWDDVEVHHANYQGENDRVGVNIFPVCGSKQDPGSCHHWLHQQGNWIVDKWDPVWGNHNVASTIKRLQRGYATGNPEGHDIPWLGIGVVVAIGFILGWLFLRPSAPTVTVRQLANVRSTPNGKVLCKVQKGDRLSIVDDSSTWIKVKACGTTGVIFKEMVQQNAN